SLRLSSNMKAAAASSPFVPTRLANTAPMPSSIVRSAPAQKASFPEVMITPLMAVSAAILSTSAPSSSITLVLMTFIERSAMSHVMRAMPSASVSSLKFAMAGSSLVWLAVLLGVTRTFFVALHHHVDVRIVRALGGGARTDLDKNRIAIRAIDQTVTVRHAGLPGCRISWLEHDLAAVLAQHHFTLEHVDELVLALMPVALR